MNLTSISLVAVALGTDALSMAIGLGLTGMRKKKILLIAGTVALFHVIMPLAGLFLGSLLGRMVGKLAGVIGAVILIYIGAHMLWEVYSQKFHSSSRKPLALINKGNIRIMTGFSGILVLSGSVSLDALTVGFGLGTLMVNLWLTVAIMGIVAGLMTLMGFVFGSHLGKWLGNRAQAVGGIVLIFIGFKMLFFSS